MSCVGNTRAEYDSLRSRIIHRLAQVEALIGFGEGKDIVYEHEQ
jgi:tRNA U34 5-carboxymethylaminomethyl modifying GTPase MnmE/TrmE